MCECLHTANPALSHPAFFLRSRRSSLLSSTFVLSAGERMKYGKPRGCVGQRYMCVVCSGSYYIKPWNFCVHVNLLHGCFLWSDIINWARHRSIFSFQKKIPGDFFFLLNTKHERGLIGPFVLPFLCLSTPPPLPPSLSSVLSCFGIMAWIDTGGKKSGTEAVFLLA